MALKGVQLGEGGRDGQPPLPPYSPPSEEAPLPTMGYVGEPICPGLGVDYPFPPHLEYLYPPPDGNILTNIVNALIAVPRLYTQVLHLMNKMNLPAPFRPAMPTPPLPPLQPPECVPPPPPEPQAADLSSGESELESSDEGEVESVDPDKVKAEQQHENLRKRKRPGAVLGPAADKESSHEAAGVKSVTLTAKESSSVKKKQPVMQIKIAARGIAAESGHERKMKVAESPVDDISEAKGESPGCATREELLAGRVPPEELLSLPTFKNYTPGNPTAVLYLKNLAKDVTVEDLYHIFGAFFAGPDEAKAALNIKLMQEGRMRGQAFVTFPRTEMAAESLSTTNGFLLKDKPMIVQFRRNPSGAKAPA